MTRRLLFCGVIGPALFVLVFLIEGATRPGYDAWRTTISTLSWGRWGWTQIANFLLFGLLMLAFAAGLRRALGAGAGVVWASALIGLAGLGLITAGLFLTDPILGYPPAAFNLPAQSLHGAIHNSASLIVFLAIPAAGFVLAPRFARDPAWRGWAAFSIASGVAILMLIGWFFACVVMATHQAGAVNNFAGLAERVLSFVGCGWLCLLAWKSLQVSSGHPRSSAESS